jgi:tetratricopeptide (TPR) repeat protein
LEQATVAHTTRRFGLAHRLYESVLGLDPDSVEVNRLVGLMNLETGDYAKALPHFEKVLSLDEFNGEIWLAYAKTLIKLDRLEEAQIALNFVKKIRSCSDVAHNTVDSFMFDAGKKHK